MGSYGKKMKSINLPSILLLKMINSLEAQLQYEHWIFLNILKQKNVHLQCSYLDNWTWRKYIRYFGENGQPSSRSVATLRYLLYRAMHRAIGVRGFFKRFNLSFFYLHTIRRYFIIFQYNSNTDSQDSL